MENFLSGIVVWPYYVSTFWYSAVIGIRDHSFIMLAKFSEKLYSLTP